MHFNFIGHISRTDNQNGKLLEDLSAMYFTKIIKRMIGASLTYDSGSGGADFVFGLPDGTKIVFEVGTGKKDFSQVESTSKKVKSKYGVNLSMTPQTLSKDSQNVSVPISYFLLI
jgi:hypothetical protein